MNRFNEAAGIHRRKLERRELTPEQRLQASMRPPEFTGGNRRRYQARCYQPQARFNEAAGIHRRKRSRMGEVVQAEQLASMRPPEFTGGNTAARC